MKKFKIAHLYYDLMNLYGENGNIRYLVKCLEEQGIEVEVHFLSMEDKIDFTKYDFYYIGMGSEENKMIILDNIMKYKDDIHKAFEDNKFFLVTGNAIELFGEGIINLSNELKVTLETFKYQVKEEDFRIVGEQFYNIELDIKENKILGFQNRNTILEIDDTDHLFNVIKGTGNKPNSNIEGIMRNRFFGTYLLGPILVRNPYFTDYLVNEICKDLNVKFKANNGGMAYRAYHEYIKNFHGEQ